MCAGLRAHPELMDFFDEELTIEWKSVLPVCRQCRAKGALPLARTRKKNGANNARRATRVRLTAPAPQAATDGDVPFTSTCDFDIYTTYKQHIIFR